MTDVIKKAKRKKAPLEFLLIMGGLVKCEQKFAQEPEETRTFPGQPR